MERLLNSLQELLVVLISLESILTTVDMLCFQQL
jgi:hypothetical protein